MRRAEVRRKTKETDISAELVLDGKGKYEINTPIPFLNHMLGLMAYHGRFDLKINATGDIDVDFHHLIEDLGIVIGEALKEALGKKEGIKRYGNAVIPMDESLAEVTIDLSGRPYLVYRVQKRNLRLRDLEVSLFEDFFRALSNNALMNLHIMLHYGRDPHHIYEAIFKAFGRALKEAVSIEPGLKEAPSTKGTL